MDLCWVNEEQCLSRLSLPWNVLNFIISSSRKHEWFPKIRWDDYIETKLFYDRLSLAYLPICKMEILFKGSNTEEASRLCCSASRFVWLRIIINLFCLHSRKRKRTLEGLRTPEVPCPLASTKCDSLSLVTIIYLGHFSLDSCTF